MSTMPTIEEIRASHNILGIDLSDDTLTTPAYHWAVVRAELGDAAARSSVAVSLDFLWASLLELDELRRAVE